VLNRERRRGPSQARGVENEKEKEKEKENEDAPDLQSRVLARGAQGPATDQGTRAAGRLQICSAYSRIVRSLENLPTRAVFKIALRAQPALSR
jgi:hypothetical protein